MSETLSDGSEVVPDFNAGQRQKVADLGFMALDVVDALEGEHLILDAMLLVEIAESEDDEPVSFAVHYFSTTNRAAIQRGLIEHVRDELARFAED